MESKIASAAWVTAPGQWEPGALRWVFYDCNVLGDPAMAVYTDNPLNDLQTEFPSTMALGSYSMKISVASSGSPARGLTCVALKDGIIIGESVTDASGNAVIKFDIIPENPGDAKLIVSGYNCVPAAYSFTIVNYSGSGELDENQAMMSVSPNPAKGKIQIEAFLKTKCDYNLKIYNTEGKTMLANERNTTDERGRITLSLDISSMRPGYYTCEIISGKMRISRTFIIY